MQDERWQQFVELAKSQFEEVEVWTEDLVYQTEDGPQIQGTVDILEFEKSNGDRFRLERENRPVVLDKKMHFAKRASDTAQTEYVLSDSEYSHKIKVYQEDMSGEWEEVTLSDLGLG
ncbi:MAG: hypothetical protein R3B41_03920 [Candidatus Doudnabacteria bacterium]